MRAEQQIRAAYDVCAATLASDGASAALSDLVRQLDAIRSAAGPDEWRAATAAARSSATHALLCEDPYTGDAFHKPRGYPGDARTLDYVYGFRGAEGASQTGRELFAVSTAVPIAVAVRERCRHVADAIASRLRVGPSRVVSIACGHMRELNHLPADAREAGTFVAVDQDLATLQTLASMQATASLQIIHGRVRALVVGRVPLPSADLVYASGLFDYLRTDAAAALVVALARHLAPGGTLLVANLTAANPEIAYMEAVMDWWMQYRTVDDMLRFAERLTPLGFTVEAYQTSASRVAWLKVTAPLGDDA
jgi:SAM-dependent methyltransferase